MQVASCPPHTRRERGACTRPRRASRAGCRALALFARTLRPRRLNRRVRQPTMLDRLWHLAAWSQSAQLKTAVEEGTDLREKLERVERESGERTNALERQIADMEAAEVRWAPAAREHPPRWWGTRAQPAPTELRRSAEAQDLGAPSRARLASSAQVRRKELEVAFEAVNSSPTPSMPAPSIAVTTPPPPPPAAAGFDANAGGFSL
eukprot:4983719-Prymnesium_polylepis.1